MTVEQRDKMLECIDERIERIMDSMDLITDQRMIGLLDWQEYEEKREVLAIGRTALELEKKLLTEEYDYRRNNQRT